MLELYYSFFDKYCDVTKFEELEKDTNSLYLALSQNDLYNCIRPAFQEEWISLRSGGSKVEVSPNSTTNFFPHTCCAKLKKPARRKSGLINKKFRYTGFNCLRSKTYCCSYSQSNKFKSSNNGFNERTLEDSGDGPMSKYRKVLEEGRKLIVNKVDFPTIQHTAATYEQTKKGLSCFYNKKKRSAS